MTHRPSGRAPNEMRTVKFSRHYTMHAEGSVLVEFGDTKVLCNATIEDRVPGFLKGKGEAGSPRNMACCRVQRIRACVVKRRRDAKVAAL